MDGILWVNSLVGPRPVWLLCYDPLNVCRSRQLLRISWGGRVSFFIEQSFYAISFKTYAHLLFKFKWNGIHSSNCLEIHWIKISFPGQATWKIRANLNTDSVMLNSEKVTDHWPLKLCLFKHFVGNHSWRILAINSVQDVLSPSHTAKLHNMSYFACIVWDVSRGHIK